MTKNVNFKLKELISNSNMTQKEIASKAGIRENTLSDLLKNDKKGIRFSTLEKLANVFDIQDINEIITLVDETTN
jgi:DNA-binding helix-turn-helix protein